jgi:hypothetical protein
MKARTLAILMATGLAGLVGIGWAVVRFVGALDPFAKQTLDSPGDCHTTLAKTTSCHGEDSSFQECMYHFRAEGSPDPALCREFLASTPASRGAPATNGCVETSSVGWQYAYCGEYGLEGYAQCYRCVEHRPENHREIVEAFDPSCTRGVVLVGCNEKPH